MPISKKVEKKLEQSSNKRNIEDYEFLMNMKTNREGGIGGFDKKKLLTEKRKMQRKKITQNLSNSLVCLDDQGSETNESSSSEEEYLLPPRKKQVKNNSFQFNVTANKDFR